MRPIYFFLTFATCLPAQITFNPSSNTNIAAVVAASPEGTQFLFLPGVYRNVQIVPRNRQVFTGQPGAVLNGSALITSFVRSGSAWAIPNQSQVGWAHGECDATHPRCMYSQDLFIDDKPQKHVATRGEVTTGTYYFDYPGRTVYFGTDPAGHKVELGVSRVAFAGPARSVTIEGLVVEKYAIEGQFGAIGELNAGPGWIVRKNEVRLNHGVGITLATDGVASQNYVHDNGQLGIGSAESGAAAINNIVIENNQISFNNWAGFSTGWQAGGVKICTTTNSVVRNNNVHHNFGPGLWSDISSTNLIYEGNTVMNNRSMGIVHEISFQAIIRNNTVAGNYDSERNWVWGAQIMIQNSGSVEAYGNIVEVGAGQGDGIVVVQQNRGTDHLARNNYVHHNTIIYGGTNGYSGVAGDFDLPTLTGTNRFNYNTYQFSETDPPHWVWYIVMSRSQLQSSGQEVSGRFGARLTPLLSPWPM